MRVAHCKACVPLLQVTPIVAVGAVITVGQVTVRIVSTVATQHVSKDAHTNCPSDVCVIPTRFGTKAGYSC